jgi:hypothetical protein
MEQNEESRRTALLEERFTEGLAFSPKAKTLRTNTFENQLVKLQPLNLLLNSDQSPTKIHNISKKTMKWQQLVVLSATKTS